MLEQKQMKINRLNRELDKQLKEYNELPERYKNLAASASKLRFSKGSCFTIEKSTPLLG